MVIELGDDVWLTVSGEDLYGTLLSVSQPYKSGNVTYANGEPIRGREYVIFVEEDEE